MNNGGAAFINSSGKLSGPVLLLFLSLFAHFSISAAVKGVVNFVGLISKKGATFSTVKRDSKKLVIISVFSSGFVTISPSLFSTTTFTCSFLFRLLIASYALLSGLGKLLMNFILLSKISISICFFLFLSSFRTLFLSFLSSTLLLYLFGHLCLT